MRKRELLFCLLLFCLLASPLFALPKPAATPVSPERMIKLEQKVEDVEKWAGEAKEESKELRREAEEAIKTARSETDRMFSRILWAIGIITFFLTLFGIKTINDAKRFFVEQAKKLLAQAENEIKQKTQESLATINQCVEAAKAGLLEMENFKQEAEKWFKKTTGKSIEEVKDSPELEKKAEVEKLIEALKDEDKLVGGAAAFALGTIRSKEAVPPLMAVLKDKAEYVRGHAAHALGEIGDQSAVPALQELLNDPVEDVRRAAKAALEKITGR